MRKRTTKNTTNSSQAKETVNQAANDNQQPLTFRSAERLRLSAKRPDWVKEHYGHNEFRPFNITTSLGSVHRLTPVLPRHIAMSLIMGETVFDADVTMLALIASAHMTLRNQNGDVAPMASRRQETVEDIVWMHDSGLLMRPEYHDVLAHQMALVLLASMPANEFVKIDWCDMRLMPTSRYQADFAIRFGTLADYTAAVQPK